MIITVSSVSYRVIGLAFTLVVQYVKKCGQKGTRSVGGDVVEWKKRALQLEWELKVLPKGREHGVEVTIVVVGAFASWMMLLRMYQKGSCKHIVREVTVIMLCLCRLSPSGKHTAREVTVILQIMPYQLNLSRARIAQVMVIMEIMSYQPSLLHAHIALEAMVAATEGKPLCGRRLRDLSYFLDTIR